MTIKAREVEYKKIQKIAKNYIETNKSAILYVYGVPGSGKTYTITKAFESIKFTYINCNNLGSKSRIYSKILQKFECKTSKSTPSLLSLVEHLQSCDKPHILVLDKIDLLKTRTHSILYNIYSLPYYDNSSVLLITVSNSFNLDIDEKILSRIGNNKLMFQAYKSDQLLEILGTSGKTTEYVARRVAAVSGDARKALLLYKECKNRSIEEIEQRLKVLRQGHFLGVQLFFLPLLMNSKIKTQTDFLNFVESYYEEKTKLKRCYKCGGNVYKIKNYRLVRCGRKNCRTKNELFNSELLKNSQLDIKTAMLIVYYLTTGILSKNIEQILGVSRKTVRRFKKCLKGLLKQKFRSENSKIGGEGIVVEIDESKFGKRKYNRGRMVEGVWVLGLVERTLSKKIVLIIVDKRDKTTLIDKINRFVHEGSKIYTDKWKGYNGLEQFNYEHSTVNHSTNFVDPITGTHTQTIEGSWSGIKQGVPKRYRNKKDIVFYLLLFMFKRNFGSEFY